jgi:hypothetical protein
MSAGEPVMAFGRWRNNAELIADCVRLGYIDDDRLVCDPTYGLGRFWIVYRPEALVASDLNPARSPCGYSVDFTAMPWSDDMFGTVVFDPPYKLNGTGGSHASDEAYGVALAGVRWQDRMQLCRDGITECVRVLKLGGHLLVKCQDQVCSVQVRWQTHDFAAHAESLGSRLVDALHLPSYRSQPEGRSQRHARRNYSTMLVFRLEGRDTDRRRDVCSTCRGSGADQVYIRLGFQGDPPPCFWCEGTGVGGAAGSSGTETP